MNYIYLIAVGLLFNACVPKNKTYVEILPIIQEKKKVHVKEYVLDLKSISQDVEIYSKNLKTVKLSSQSSYEEKYFRVWNIKQSKISLNDAMWAHRAYKSGNTFGENFQLLKQSFFDLLLDNSNYDEYLSVNKKALTLKRLNIRAMPSIEPVIFDPQKAGEGLPFDYLQNSSIAANKPILISHYSKDKKWAFIESSFTYGWVKSANIVIIDEKYTKLWQQAEQIFITTEGRPIYSEGGEFLFDSRIGMMFALIEEDAKSYSILTVSKYKNKKPLYLKSTINKNIAHKGTLAFSSTNVNKILKEVSKTNYGWGGIYGQRDCSSTLRDFYAPFGLWLPRNSYQQSLNGRIIPLVGLRNDEKLESIAKNAEPFRTLVYKKGHIALYVGMENNKPIIYQNVWGVKTINDGVEGRFVIGRPIFSTLEVGSNLENYDSNSSMLRKLKSISTL